MSVDTTHLFCLFLPQPDITFASLYTYRFGYNVMLSETQTTTKFVSIFHHNLNSQKRNILVERKLWNKEYDLIKYEECNDVMRM